MRELYNKQVWWVGVLVGAFCVVFSPVVEAGLLASQLATQHLHSATSGSIAMENSKGQHLSKARSQRKVHKVEGKGVVRYAAKSKRLNRTAVLELLLQIMKKDKTFRAFAVKQYRALPLVDQRRIVQILLREMSLKGDDNEDHRDRASTALDSLFPIVVRDAQMYEAVILSPHSGAASELGDLARKLGNKVMPVLMKMLSSQSLKVRAEISDQISQTPKLHMRFLPGLLKVLMSAKPKVYENISLAIFGYGNKAVPSLLRLVHHPKKKVRARAVESIKKVHPIHVRFLPAFLKLLSHRDNDVVDELLTVFGTYSRKAVPGLLKIIKTKPDRTKIWAIKALVFCNVKHASVMKVLKKLKKHKNSKVVDEAVAALSSLRSFGN